MNPENVRACTVEVGSRQVSEFVPASRFDLFYIVSKELYMWPIIAIVSVGLALLSLGIFITDRWVRRQQVWRETVAQQLRTPES